MPTHEECMVLTPIHRHRNPPLLGPCDLGLFRFIIMFTLQIKLTCEGHSQNVGLGV
jgi:hypothetical protein